MNTNDFEFIGGFDAHWLFSDSLSSIKQELTFNMGTTYYCEAGCKVCYIKDNLEKSKSISGQYFPPITDQQEEIWNDLFDYFMDLHNDDDMTYLKLNHPNHYDWFKRNGHNFSHGITDNALFRFTKQIGKEIKFKEIRCAGISASFAETVSVDKLTDTLLFLQDNFSIRQLNLINDGNIDALEPYFKFAYANNIIPNLIYDITRPRNYVSRDWITRQVTHINTSEQGDITQIYGNEEIQLCFNRFFYSNGESSGSAEPYHVIEHKFNPEQFLYDLAKGKQDRYQKWINTTASSDFKQYYETVAGYQLYNNYNYIPGTMLPPKSRFCAKLEENGWMRTNLGLFKPDADVKPFVSKL